MQLASASTVSWIWFFAALVGGWFTWNAFRPIYRPSLLAAISFFSGWFTSELPLHHIAWQLLLSAIFIQQGALAYWPGRLALLASVLSWGFLLVAWRRAGGTAERYRAALDPVLGESGLSVEEEGGGIDWRAVLLPFPIRRPDVERLADVTFHAEAGHRLRLDVYRRRGATPPVGGAPTLIYVHGGGWVIGGKDEQGLPLLQHLAARGWVCVGISYRKSPRATFPDHLVDVKRAIAHVRAHAAEWGGDPDFLVIAGGSAGGHLAALAALTPGQARFQPGFEGADTRVAGCVPFYGIYDFTDRHGHWPHPGFRRLLERMVMKRSLEEDPEGYRDASPIDQVSATAPPFLVIHGDLDSLVPIGEARRFVEALAAESAEPAVLVEIPGAQHAFEIFPSLRTTLHLRGVTRFVTWLHARYALRRQRPAAAPN